MMINWHYDNIKDNYLFSSTVIFSVTIAKRALAGQPNVKFSWSCRAQLLGKGFHGAVNWWICMYRSGLAKVMRVRGRNCSTTGITISTISSGGEVRTRRGGRERGRTWGWSAFFRAGELPLLELAFLLLALANKGGGDNLCTIALMISRRAWPDT